jgi:hypothetical protein
MTERLENNHKSVQFGTQHIHLRLGGVLQLVLTPYELAHTHKVYVSVANETWYGNFTVPMAVGFSTPVSLLQGGTMSINMSEPTLDPEFYHLYQQWSACFSGEGVRKITKKTVTQDQLSCHICLKEYSVGDLIHKLDSCGHIFHLDCISQWIVSNCQFCRDYGSFRFHCSHTASTIVSNPTSCPLCRVQTIV